MKHKTFISFAIVQLAAFYTQSASAGISSYWCRSYYGPNIGDSPRPSCSSCYYVVLLWKTKGQRVKGGCGFCGDNYDKRRDDDNLRSQHARGDKDVEVHCHNCLFDNCNSRAKQKRHGGYFPLSTQLITRTTAAQTTGWTDHRNLTNPTSGKDSSTTSEAQTTPNSIINRAGPHDGTVQMAIIIGTLAGVFLLLTIVSCLAYRRISKKCKDKPITESSGSRQLGILSQGDELATSTTPVSFKDCTTTSAITERSLDNARKSKSIQCYADVPTSPYSVSYGTESHSHEELVHAEDHPDHHLQPISDGHLSPGSKHPMPRQAVQSPVAKYATSDSPVSKPFDPVLDRDATKSPVSSILREQRRSGRHQPPMSPQLVMDRLMQRGHQADESTPTTPTSTAVDPTFTSMASAMSISLYNPGKASKKSK